MKEIIGFIIVVVLFIFFFCFLYKLYLKPVKKEYIPLAKIKVLGFTSTSKGQKNVSLSYTDESGVTLTKVIKVTIVDAENKDAEPKKGCGGTIVTVSVIVAVVLIGAVVAVLVLKKNKKSA